MHSKRLLERFVKSPLKNTPSLHHLLQKTENLRLLKADSIFKIGTGLAASSVLILLALMAYELIQQSWLSIQKFGLGFFVGTDWDPAITQTFGALPLIYGTMVTSVIALLLGVPVSIGIALTLSELSPRSFKAPVSFIVELLAAIPSVIYGLWGIFTLAPVLRDFIYPPLQRYLGFLPLFQGPIYGLGILTGGIILAIMITPTVSAVCRDVFAAVPNHQREAAAALGSTRWETARLVMSYGRSGVIGAIMLGLGRAVGETMAITMVIGNKFQFPTSLFDAGYTLAAVIANEFTEATYDLYVSVLVEVGLVLFVVAMIVNVFAQVIVWHSLKVFRGAVFE